jgi:hypothetical protein
MQPHGFTDLGGREKTIDNRDIPLGAVAIGAPKTYTFAPTFTNFGAFHSDVEYQGQQPACGAHSGTKHMGIQDDTRYTPRFTWTNIKTFDGNPLEAGTDLRSIFKSLTKTGAVDFDLLGNDITGTLQAYAHPTITPEMTANAATHKAPGYGFATDFTLNGLKQYIYDHGSIVLLFRVGNEMWTAPNGTPSWAEKDILPLRPPATVVSGHFVVCHSYDDQYIYFINSFSKDWGRVGHGYFGEDYLQYVNDAGALIDLMFSKDLHFGMTDPEVKQLQQILNKDPRTQIASSGNGSPSNETTYFGTLTQNAVIKFQTLYSIKPNVGYVGPLTRAVLNALAGV